MSVQSRHSERTVRTHRSANAFARGVRNGVTDDLDAFGLEHLVERSRVLGITIVDQDGGPLERTVDGEVPGLLGHPARVGVLRHPGEMHLAGGELDEEQDVQRLQTDGLDHEEVVREDALSLASEEL
jgi:hypothetical protein